MIDDYESAMNQLDNAAPTMAVTALDENPDDGARVLKLSKATGIKPQIIHADLEGFEKEHKASMTAYLVRNNDQLANYIRGNPMADVVSNDDYGNLDKFTREGTGNALAGLGKHITGELISGALGGPVIEPLLAGILGASQGAYEAAKGILEEPLPQSEDEMKYAPAGLKAQVYAAELVKRAASGAMGVPFGAVVGGAKGVISDVARSAGADENTVGRLQRDAQTLIEAEMGRAGESMRPAAEATVEGRYHGAVEAVHKDIHEAAKPWVDAGLQPPRGVHPKLDEVYTKLNADILDQIEEDLTNAQSSLTKDRDLDLFSKVAEGKYGESTIGISGDRVVELYGDRAPEADDNILGWVPGIADKLEAARMGDDVHIPLKDWVTRVDPALAKDLHDDIRTWPGGITAREAEEHWEPKPVIDAPMSLIRDANGTEPMFSIGDRKLELKQVASMPGFEEFHEYQFHDQDGKPIGELTIVPDPAKRQLYVANINGLAGLYANSFGPSLVRDLKRQLKEIYPDYETITGHRVSGAREVAGVVEEAEKSHPVVKLSADEDHQTFADFHDILEQGVRNHYGYNVYATHIPTELLTAEHERISQVVNDEINKLTGGAVGIHPVSDIYHRESPLGAYIGGVHINRPGNTSKILYDLFGQDPMGVGRHESIHYLYGSGFFKPEEWQALLDASKSEGWLDRYNVPNRYPKLDELKQHEEAIADAFRDWASSQVKQPDTLVTRAFEKIKQLWNNVQAKFRELFGRELSPEELFQKVSSGEVGAREGTGRPTEPAFSRDAARADRMRRGQIAKQEYAEDAVERVTKLRDSNIQSLKDAEERLANAQTRGDKHLLKMRQDFVNKVKGYLKDSEQDLANAQAELKNINNEIEEQSKYLGGASFSIDEEFKARMDNLRAGAAGLTTKSFQQIQKLIKARFDEDIAASLKRAEKEQARTQTKEWKAASADLSKEVESTIRQRPDVMADLLIGSGELAGKKLRQRYPLRADDLTPEQKALLPKHYYSADGLPVDGVAKMVGFPSGEAMIEKLGEYNRDKGNLSSQEMLRKTINDETNRQMTARHGDLQKNIMLDAQDQALSENNLNILAEEWQGAAISAGVSVVDKDVAKAEALRVFGNLRMGDVDTTRLLTQMSKHYRDATDSLITGDSAKALVSLQRRYEIGLLAAEAKKLEKEQKAFERTAKQFSKRDVPTVEPEYTNFIHGILMQVGKPVRRSIQDLEKQIGAGESKSLEDFVANKTASLREVPVWDQLYDTNFRKPVEELTTTEFRAVHGSIKALVFNGRDERKIYRQGEAADLADVKKDLIDKVADSAGGEVTPPKVSGKLSYIGSKIKSYYVQNLQMENILNRWDGFDAKGTWNQYIMRDLIDGSNQFEDWKKEYGKKLRDLEAPKDLTKAVENKIFKDQDKDMLMPLSRQNLIAVMMNTGTQSNLVKMAKGYKLEPAVVMSWIHEHATAEDWKFVQGVWDIWKDIKSRGDTMYRSLSGGVPPEDIPAIPVQTKFGTLPGGYYPIIFHSEMEGKSKTLMGKGPLEQENFVRATTPAGWTKSRTGYVAPLALDMDAMPGRMSQHLNDIALRPAVLNAAKIFYDHDVRSAVRKYYGNEYKEQLVPYLQAVANAANRDNRSQMAWSQVSEFFRQNVVTTLVGLNPGTVLKHGPSALVSSIREVGPIEFAKAVTGLHRVNDTTGESNWQFAIRNSLELQRRDRNWQETLYGSAGVLSPGDKYGEWRQRIMEWSSKPVAMSDMLSAVPTWMAAYEKEMRESGVHGDAVYAADRAVRRAHGSTAITSRTTIQRDWNPWLTSVYNYFSDIMNRQMETIWKAGKTLDMVKEGNYKSAMATVPALTASLFAYAIWPAIVEHMVSPSEDNEKDSWPKKAGKQLAFTLGSSWPGVRDAVTAFTHGRDPQYGLTGTAAQEVANVVRDLSKDHPFAKEHSRRLIQDGVGFVGTLTGMVPAQLGRSAAFIHGVETKIEHPRTAWAWMTGLRFGTTKGHSTSVENYLKGKNQ